LDTEIGREVDVVGVAGISRVAVPSEAGTPAMIGFVSVYEMATGEGEFLTGQSDATVRGNGILLQFDGDGAA